MTETIYSDAVEDVRRRLHPGEIAGWSDFVPFYDMVVAEAPPDSVIVEVGVFCGKSLIHLARAAQAANKGLRIYGVDTFRGSPEFKDRVWFDDKPILECHPAVMIAECVANLQNHGVRDDVTLIISDSAKAADLFKPQEVFAVMLDGGHSYPTVLGDIQAWSGKIQRGGYLAGDDYHGFPGVQDAVHECFEEGEYTIEGCYWQVKYK